MYHLQAALVCRGQALARCPSNDLASAQLFCAYVHAYCKPYVAIQLTMLSSALQTSMVL